MLRRALCVCAWAALFMVAGATSALAHGRGTDATNFSSRIQQAPTLPGVEWRVIGGDEYLAVTNESAEELLIFGYEGEPYLRIGPEGVLRNAASPATYLNETRYGQLTSDLFPPDVGPEMPPRWEQVSTDAGYAWHDHRIHWMAPTLPPQVTDPAKRTFVTQWEVPLQAAGVDHQVTGQLEWVPPPPPGAWLAAAGAIAAVALAGSFGRSVSPRRMVRPAAAVLAGTAALNVAQLVDDLFAVPVPASTAALAAVQTALFVAVAAVGAARAWRAGRGAFTALGVGSVALFLGQGLLYRSVLTSSQTTSVFPPAVSRAAVALSLAQLVPVGLVAVFGARRETTASHAASAPDGPAVA